MSAQTKRRPDDDVADREREIDGVLSFGPAGHSEYDEVHDRYRYVESEQTTMYRAAETGVYDA